MWRWLVATLALLGVAGGVWIAVGRDGEPEGPLAPPPVKSLLRPETLVTAVRKADLDGDGVVEVVVASRSKLFTHFELPSQYLDVFAFRDGSWRRIFDATTDLPAGASDPEGMLDTPAEDVINRLVDSVRVVDLDGDGSSELVIGVATIGAGVGPLELWILSLEGGQLRTEFYDRTTRGGEIAVDGKRVVFEFPVYRPRDPGCCPSRLERQVIGVDEGTGAVTVLQRSRRRVSAASAPPG